MGNFVFNVALGRVNEYYNRVKSNDPAASTLTIVGVDVVAVADATIKDLDTLALVISAGVFEVTSTNYARKVLADTDLLALTTGLDDANDRFRTELPDQTWLAVASAGAHPNFTDLIVCYDPAGTGVTSAMIPLTQHDFPITVDGSDVLADFQTVAAAGFFQAA